MATCSSCHAPVLWCLTETGARMPIDPDPVVDGIVIKTGRTQTVGGDPRPVDIVRVLKKAERTLFDPESDDEQDEVRFNSHFVTCPDRDKHRKPR